MAAVGLVSSRLRAGSGPGVGTPAVGGAEVAVALGGAGERSTVVVGAGSAVVGADVSGGNRIGVFVVAVTGGAAGGEVAAGGWVISGAGGSDVAADGVVRGDSTVGGTGGAAVTEAVCGGVAATSGIR